MQVFEESLDDVIKFCKAKGYEVELDCNSGLYTCNLMKDGKTIKKGKIKYELWGQAYKESYTKLYNVLLSI